MSAVDDRYLLQPDGTAVVAITGTLLNRPTRASAYFGVPTYRELLARIEAARADPKVCRIVLEIDSYGGVVSGVFDFADALFAMRDTGPPIIAAVNETAASAAYLIAAAASEVVIPTTARVGSIGVVVAHLDISKAMEAAGYAMTYIHAGDKKIDGNPYSALPGRVRDELQAQVDDTYALFVDRVAQYRGIASTAVRATQAGMFTGANAVAAGLASRVDSFRAVLDNRPTIPMGSVTKTPPREAARMNNTASAVAKFGSSPAQLSASEVWDRVLADQHARLGVITTPDEKAQANGDASVEPAAIDTATGSVWDQVFAILDARGTPSAGPGATQARTTSPSRAGAEGELRRDG